MSLVAKYGILFRDAEGFTGAFTARVFADTQVHATAFANAIEPLVKALSNGVAVGYSGLLSQNTNPDFYGAAADYLSATFRAEFLFNTSDGSIIRVGVPSPKRSIFLADGQTVDAANTDVSAFHTAMITGLSTAVTSDANGTPAINYVIGYLRKSRLRRKLTIWTMSPGLDEPGE